MSEKSTIYAFNLIAEAKVRALVILTKKHHPDWTDEQIEDHLKRLVGYAVEKVLKNE